MTDQDIVAKLIDNDQATIQKFFFVQCREMLTYIGQYFCSDRQKPEQLVGEFYEFLSANDWHKLRIFHFTCPLKSYVSIIASRYFKQKRDKEMISLDESIGVIKDFDEVKDMPNGFFMEDLNRVLKKLGTFDRFLVERILIKGEKPGDIVDDAINVIQFDPTIKTNATDRKKFAGYIYTRYNRIRKSLQQSMKVLGYA